MLAGKTYNHHQNKWQVMVYAARCPHRHVGPIANVPIVVGIGGHHAALNALQPATQPHLIHVEMLQHAALVVEVHGQHRQCAAGSCICKLEDIKLPA